MEPKTAQTIGGYSIRFDGIDDVKVENYVAEVGNFTVSTAGAADRHLTPERRVYTASGTPTTEAAIETYGFSQLYLQLGEQGGRRQPRRPRLVQALCDAGVAGSGHHGAPPASCRSPTGGCGSACRAAPPVPKPAPAE